MKIVSYKRETIQKVKNYWQEEENAFLEDEIF